jgi:hypothetical protein
MKGVSNKNKIYWNKRLEGIAVWNIFNSEPNAIKIDW